MQPKSSIYIMEKVLQRFARSRLYTNNEPGKSGKLYVALSRGKSFQDVEVMVKTTAEQGKILKGKKDGQRIPVFTKNIVYRELFSQNDSEWAN